MLHRERIRGIDRLHAITAVLQRARLADPEREMWEAADVQWWWRRPRLTDDLGLTVWFDQHGPVAAVGLTAWEGSWQIDLHFVPSLVDVAEVWESAMAEVDRHCEVRLEILVFGDDPSLADLASSAGFEDTGELSGTAWMDSATRPPTTDVAGFALVDRATRPGGAHPMTARNGEQVERRLGQTSLYDPTLDLAVVNDEGTVAGYALFWHDPLTGVGLLEPMRVEEEFWRRGLGRMLLAHGLERLALGGATRLKVGFESEIARNLYLGAGFVQTSVDRVLVRTTQ